MRCLLLIFVMFLMHSPFLSAQTINFSQERGFYTNPFDVVVSTKMSNATIFYTLDGSDPKKSGNAMASNGPVTIHVHPDSARNRPLTPCFTVRAFAQNSKDTTESITHTYLFLNKIITQKGDAPGPGWPDNSVNGQVIDYGMDSDVYNHPDYKDLVDDALLAIPSISVNMDIAHLFDPAVGIYVNAERYGREWERPMSMELIYPDGRPGFQINGGIRIRGGYSRLGGNPKHAFRLFFRGEYGPKKLAYPLFENEGVSSFDKLDLRTAQNYSWSGYGDVKNTFLREVFCRDLQGDMGHVYSKSRYYHLYLNGMYWGLFMSQERQEAFFSASYMKGDEEDYDVVKADKNPSTGALETVVTDGNPDLWNELWNLAVNGFTNEDDYLYALGKKDSCGYKKKLLDEENLIDYMLSIFFTGDFDAPITNFGNNDSPNNFFCSINRVDPDGFKFYRHDGEHTFFDLNTDRTGPFSASGGDINRSNPQYLHQQLMNRREYRMHFADRVYRHLFNNGVLTEAKCKERLHKRFLQIETAIIAESVRWGDAKSENPRTKNEHWLPAVNYLTNEYFPQRKGYLISQLINDGLFTNLMPPIFLHDNVPVTTPDLTVETGYEIAFTDTSQNTQNIYYTLDGTDPMLGDGSVNPKAINASTVPTVKIKHTTVINARTYQDSAWSPLHYQRFFIPQNFSTLRFTEIMYHPTEIADIDGKNLEFLELKNTHETDTLYLTGVEFSEGIDYKFEDGTFLAPQAFFVLASNPCDLKLKCPGIKINGKNFGRMSNSSETLEAKDHAGNIILNITYQDKAPWPNLPDGKGYSLVPVQTNPTGDPSDPLKWTASHDNVCGSPGKDDPSSVSGIKTLKTADIQVFPNPFTDGFSILIPDLGSNEPYTINAFNLNGLKIYEQKGTSHRSYLPTQTWNKGMYFLKVTNPKGQFVKKIVKY